MSVLLLDMQMCLYVWYTEDMPFEMSKVNECVNVSTAASSLCVRET